MMYSADKTCPKAHCICVECWPWNFRDMSQGHILQWYRMEVKSRHGDYWVAGSGRWNVDYDATKESWKSLNSFDPSTRRLTWRDEGTWFCWVPSTIPTPISTNVLNWNIHHPDDGTLPNWAGTWNVKKKIAFLRVIWIICVQSAHTNVSALSSMCTTEPTAM